MHRANGGGDPVGGLIGRKCRIQLLQVLLITLAFVTCVGWAISEGSPQVLWALRIGGAVSAAGVGWLLYMTLSKPERLPDLLRERVGTYFEKNGLCFAPVLEMTPAGACVLAIYFQNRYAGPARARVQVLPPRRTLRLKRHDLPAPSIAFDCPGGAFGVARVSFPISAAYQGARVSFELGADVKYPEGRGELLRYRSGARVGAKRELSGVHQLLTTLVALPFGMLAISEAASVTFTLPQGVADTGPNEQSVTIEIIWWPALLETDLALPRRAAA